MAKPKPHPTLWVLTYDLKRWRGEETKPTVSTHFSEEKAARACTTRRNGDWGKQWYKVEAWIIPPQGQGRPRRQLRVIRKENKNQPK